MERSSFRWPRSLHETRFRQAGLSTTLWESLPPPVGRTRELKGIGESEQSSRLVILAGPGGVGTIRLEWELGPAPKRLAGVGDVWLVELSPRSTSRPAWRVGSASPARRVRLDRCASRIGTCSSCGQLRAGLGCLCRTLRPSCGEQMAEAPHTVLDVAGEARAAEEPFAPEVMGRVIPSRRRTLGGASHSGSGREVGYGSPASVT